MRKYASWFKNLSRVGQVSVLSAVTLGGIFAVSATTSPTPAPISSLQSPASQPELKREPVLTTKIENETQPVAFEKQTIEDGTINKGESVIKVSGVNGIKTITHTISLTDGKETERKTTEAITTAPVAEVTAIGTYVKPTPSCDTNYSGCIPIVSYDLDCSDIGYSVTVLGYDKHRLDRDNDGYGCESY